MAGVTMRLADDADDSFDFLPARCGGWGTDLAGAAGISRQRRQAIELPPAPNATVTEYRVISLVCPYCAAVTLGEASAGVTVERL